MTVYYNIPNIINLSFKVGYSTVTENIKYKVFYNDILIKESYNNKYT